MLKCSVNYVIYYLPHGNHVICNKCHLHSFHLKLTITVNHLTYLYVVPHIEMLAVIKKLIKIENALFLFQWNSVQVWKDRRFVAVRTDE